jgi:RNA polymerase sigma-54 factor
MAISPRLELRQNQSLALTPQMQQAIKLLRMTNLELAEFVAEEAEKNPLLEVVAPVRQQSAGSAVGSAGGAGDRNMLENIASAPSLYDHLHAQIGSMRLDATVAEAALFLADELDEDGYLRVPLTDVAERSGLPAKALLEGLARLQSCDPAGVGARSLKECLALQLQERDRLDPVIQTLIDNLAMAAQGRLPELARLCGVDRDELDEMLEELRALDSKPGERFGAAPVQIAVPDVHVRRGRDSTLTVELNTETMPRVLVNNAYAADLDGTDAAARTFISECSANANWLVRSMEQRARTMLRVSTEIVRRQERFFDGGPAQMRPLTRREVAEELDLHESTVSRVVAGKILSCEQGTFEVRRFFSAAIHGLDDRESFSALAVQDRIRRMILEERPPKALSDDRIVQMLKEQGIDIARRTVAKYRDSMGIPSSVRRRRNQPHAGRGRIAGAATAAGRRD